jgi:hypothetical protein
MAAPGLAYGVVFRAFFSTAATAMLPRYCVFMSDPGSLTGKIKGWLTARHATCFWVLLLHCTVLHGVGLL